MHHASGKTNQHATYQSIAYHGRRDDTLKRATNGVNDVREHCPIQDCREGAAAQERCQLSSHDLTGKMIGRDASPRDQFIAPSSPPEEFQTLRKQNSEHVNETRRPMLEDVAFRVQPGDKFMDLAATRSCPRRSFFCRFTR